MATVRVRPAAQPWQRFRSERGQGLIEAAFTLPLLISLTFGVIEMGFYMHDYIQAASCAREAARRAAIGANVLPATSYCPSPNITVTVNYPNGQQAGGDAEAHAQATHNWVVIGALIPIPAFQSPTRIDATVTMRIEGQRQQP